MEKLILRWSVDDGDIFDLKVAEILDKYGMKGIFYIAPYYNKVQMMSVYQIQELSKKHEIGAHTLNHFFLNKLPMDKQIFEIIEGKNVLEEIIKKPITKFAYPRGHFNQEVKVSVRSSGLLEARTTKMGITDITNYDCYELPCTAHLYPRPEYQEKGIKKSILDLYNKAKIGGYFNLLMHSKELERYNYWELLEEIIKYIYEDQSAKVNKNRDWWRNPFL